MIRAVLVGFSSSEWKLFRQPQWMAEVRRDPRSATFPKRYFDIEEDAYKQALDRWNSAGAASDLDQALTFLGELGSIEITRT